MNTITKKHYFWGIQSPEDMIKRELNSTIENKFVKGKSIIIIGLRQVGKTTICKNILENKDHLFLDGDDPTVRNILTNPNTEQLKRIIANHKIIFIDEAQRIENIGLTLKIITDQFKDVQILVSDSSANSYFWRTKQQQEIDYIEEESGIITGYEFKWNPNAKTKIHKIFIEAYNSTIKVINRSNSENF